MGGDPVSAGLLGAGLLLSGRGSTGKVQLGETMGLGQHCLSTRFICQGPLVPREVTASGIVLQSGP